MPIARVQMPDGRIARIEVPEGTTPEQAQRMAQSVVPKEKPSSGVGAFFQGMLDEGGKAVSNVGQFLGNPTGKGTTSPLGPILGPVIDAGAQLARGGLRQQQRLSPVRGSTAGRIAGGILATIPTAFAPGAGLAGALTQGALGGAMLTDNPRNQGQVARDVAMGMGAGALGYGAGKVLAKGASKVLPKRAPIASAPKLDRAATARQARFNRVGVQRPTTAMVTRDPAAYKFQNDILGNPNFQQPMQQALQAVDQDLGNAARAIVDRQGGAIGSEATGARVIDALGARDEALGKEVGSLYKAVRDNVGDVRVSNLDNFKAAAQHPDWVDNTAFDDMVAAVNKRLSRVADADGGATGLTVKQAEEMRKFIGGLGQNSPQTFSMRKVLQEGLDADILDNVGGQPFAEARAAAAARFGEFKGTLAGRLAGEKIAPEAVGRRLTGQGVSLDALRQTRASLEASPGGQEALQSLRAQMLDDIFSKGMGVDGKVNGGKIYGEFTKNAPRLRAVMDSEGYKEARRLAMAARDATTAVPYSGANFSQSGQTVLGGLFGGQQQAGLVNRFLNSPLGRAMAHTGANAVAPGAGSMAVEGAVQASNANANRLANKAMQQQMAAALDPATAAQTLSDIERKKLIEEMVRRQASAIGKPATLGGLGLLAGYPLIGQ